jgi:S1-C subfamily serine protease
MDIFGDSLYSEEFEFKSDQFVYNSGKDGYSDAMENAIKNVIEKSFLTFMNSNELEQILVDDLQAREEDDREVLMMSKSKSYVSNLTEATNSTVTVKTKDSFGSGFFITSDGYLLTNYHVVTDTSDLKVVLNDGSELKAEVIRVSKVHDLAILKVAKEDVLPFKTSNNSQIEIGADVFAIGTPTAEDLSQTVSKGIVSGIRTVDGGGKLIQTDASINSGNSGGPLVNKDGEVIAIVVSKVRGLGIEGVAFGIPVYDILERLHISFE